MWINLGDFVIQKINKKSNIISNLALLPIIY